MATTIAVRAGIGYAYPRLMFAVALLRAQLGSRRGVVEEALRGGETRAGDLHPGGHVRGGEVAVERGLVAPALDEHVSPGGLRVFVAAIFLAAVLRACGGDDRAERGSDRFAIGGCDFDEGGEQDHAPTVP